MSKSNIPFVRLILSTFWFWNLSRADVPEITTPLSTPFTVGSTETDTTCGMSDQQRNALLNRGFPKIICPLGVAIAGTACYPDSNLLYGANVIARLLDADEDGVADDPDILSYLLVTADDAPVVGGGCNSREEQEIDSVEEAGWGYGYSAQTYKAWEDDEEDAKRIMNEEVFHMIHQWASARAYPEALGVDDFTSSVVCREMARVVCCNPGWQHPENTCGSSCGTDVDLPLRGTCNDAGCDCVEFYHQVALTLVGATPGWYGENMPQNSNDMEGMLSDEFLEMFRDTTYHQISDPAQVSGEYNGEIVTMMPTVSPAPTTTPAPTLIDPWCKTTNVITKLMSKFII